MKRCKNCLMPNTKPGLVLKEGICQACLHAEMRKSVDYDQRFEELKELCDKHRGNGYDSIIAVSGGKDSHYQVYVFKELLKMNPLLVTVGDPFGKTKAGLHNIKNIVKIFNCDLITLQLNPNLVRRMVRIAFEKLGSPTWPIDRAIYCFPIRMGIDMKIPLVIYGENVSYEYGGIQEEETYSAKLQIDNDVAKKVGWDWHRYGIEDRELNMLKYPQGQIEPIYLSYFFPWDGYQNYQLAKRYGFQETKWNRQGYIDNYDQIDSIGYLMNVWMKYPKFGFARTTDVVGYWIRSGKITKDEAWKLIKENDHKLDPKILQDFLNFTGYTKKEFYNIIERFWNKDIFEKINNKWILKEKKSNPK